MCWFPRAASTKGHKQRPTAYKNTMCSLTVLKPRNPKSRGQQGPAHSEFQRRVYPGFFPTSDGCRPSLVLKLYAIPVSASTSTWHYPCLSPYSGSPFPVKIPTIGNLGLTLTQHDSLNCLHLQGPYFQMSHSQVLKRHEFGEGYSSVQ